MRKIGSLKVTTLVDNLVLTNGLLGEWGLSLLLELEDFEGKSHKVISDTESSEDAMLHNIRKQKINLSDLEYIFLSHDMATTRQQQSRS
jgi:metal-dependent hydrolase (beta-lactamase superfamily II)